LDEDIQIMNQTFSVDCYHQEFGNKVSMNTLIFDAENKQVFLPFNDGFGSKVVSTNLTLKAGGYTIVI
jgi:phosphosulfolactate synthase (CoM biosynthesis protein A)